MIDLDQMLVETSRTFALAIPLLPEPTRKDVTLAYLLFRIADTFEDAAHWTRQQRLDALRDFADIVREPRNARVRFLTDQWSAARPSEHQGYLRLLAAFPDVIEELERVPPARRAIVVDHARRTADGMASFVTRGDANGALRLGDVDELRRYCYVVAGIVGELLTELFIASSPALAKVGPDLRANAVSFGEGLQLVNIVKDADDDARDGRTYLPPDLDRSAVFALARRDLNVAADYVSTLQTAGGHRGFIAFTALPVLLARATLERVQRQGAGAKVSREEVARLMNSLDQALDAGRPALPAWS